MFAAWFQYAKDKKRRKRAVSEALERRRRWLYTWGVTQWIKVGCPGKRDCKGGDILAKL